MAILTLTSLTLEVLISYRRYARILTVLTASLLAYVAAAFVAHVPWTEALRHTVVPDLDIGADRLTMIVAILGTTISPYLFFWQASQEVEEQDAKPHAKPLIRAPWQAPRAFRRIRIDTLTGMFVSNLIAWFIVVTTAATLRAHGVRDIESAAQAAKALEPVAGRFASIVFSIGIVGTAMLALPVLAGSSAYAVGEALDLPVGLDRKPLEAKMFYGIIGFGTLVGLALNLLSFPAMKALVVSAVVNGVAAVPIMALTMHAATNERVMKNFVLPRALRVIGWVATALMAAAAVAMIAALASGHA
jgi:Mn2+/Fe2+ NRAMP family transporter